MLVSKYVTRGKRVHCGTLGATLFLLALSSVADSFSGNVVSVSDGDTITLLDTTQTQHKIRLSGIDAPEKVQPFGDASKRSLSALVYGREVAVEWHKRDKYGRIVGKVLLDGQDVCLEQIKAGMAWHFVKYQAEQSPEDRERYSLAEQDARNGKVGLWSDPKPVAPWDYRHPAAEPSRSDTTSPP